jgi:hypothetical protein
LLEALELTRPRLFGSCDGVFSVEVNCMTLVAFSMLPLDALVERVGTTGVSDRS